MHAARFILALHNHQPVGNFDGVFEAAYRDSYLPFLETIESYPRIPLALHSSGCLMEWLVEHHPEYVERLKPLVARGQVEILGGGFYEPILTMIPPEDRRGQIAHYAAFLEELFDTRVRGMWIPERVWEQSLVRDIVAAGIDYTVLDDFHFKCAGLRDEQLYGYYVTEDAGRMLKVFPGSERLRYLIPFADPGETIQHARGIAEQHPDAVLVFADDGEKFGAWPGTAKHVYQDGWLRRFFDALLSNSDWLELATFAQAVADTPPAGKIYLPDSSYREMTEWALPAARQQEYSALAHEMEQNPRWQQLRPYVRGGFWRNFKVKYPETDEMYCRMLEVSRRLEQLDPSELGSNGSASQPDSDTLATARQELYRGQCNCGYWHGAFGGLYLPHLRNAVFAHLIAADNALEQAAGRTAPWIEAQAGDFNLDARQEVRLANDKLVAYAAPARGGILYELDVRAVPLNVLATLTRRPEAYHQKILNSGGRDEQSGLGEIQDRLVFKQPGLEQKVAYDPYPRKSLVDHFWSPGVTLADAAACRAEEHGDFVQGVYESRIRRNPDRIQIFMTRAGQVAGIPIRLTKAVALAPDSTSLELCYVIEDLPAEFPFLFAPELGFAGLAGNAPDRFFYTTGQQNLGPLDAALDLPNADLIGLVDGWLGLDIALHLSRPAAVFTFPIQAVSQSEGGFELVHQSSTVIPHWPVQADAEGRWSVELTLALDTSAAEAKHKAAALA